LRIGSIPIITIFFLVLGLTGCQNRELTKNQPGSFSQLRIVVSGEGFFEISQKEWEEKGFTIQNLDHVQLEFKGDSYPFWVNKEPDFHKISIRFYSPKIETKINLKENVFILSEKPTDHTGRITPLIISPIQDNSGMNTTGIFKEIYQNQSIYLPQVAGEDHWLWALIQQGQRIDQEIQLSELPVESVTIRCQFWVPPTTSHNPTQLLKATINEHILETVQVNGQKWQKIEIQIDPAYLSKKNIFTIQSITSADNPPGKIYLDLIEVETTNPINLGSQSRSFMLQDDKPLNSMVSSPGTLVTIHTTEQPFDIYSIQSEGRVEIVHQPDAKYHWIPDGQFLTVSTMQTIEDEILTIPSETIEYLIVAPEIFQPTLLPLIDVRTEQGLVTMMVSPQRIYDTYQSGYPSVNSLKEFIQNVYEKNPNQLKYLLLVGDYTYAIENYQDFINYVPSFFVNSGQMGQTISDFPFADLNGDSQPELAVGRVPAETPQQVAVWVDKIIGYESSIPSKWGKMIAVSDPADSIFLETAQNFMLPFSIDYQTLIFNPPNSDEIQGIFEEPYSLVFYFGHGSIDLWGKDKILSYPMISDLPVSSAPAVLFSFSCLNGYFIHPDKISLAEGLLFRPSGGVTGILAPTGHPILENQENLIQFFQNKLQLTEYSRINELIFHQERDNFTADFSLDELWKTYVYFGDPAMLIP